MTNRYVATVLSFLAATAAAGWLEVEPITDRPGLWDYTCESNARAVVRDPSGRIHVAWRGQTFGVFQTWYSRSDSGHGRWTVDTILSHSVAGAGDPAIAHDSSARVYVAWIGDNVLSVRRWDPAVANWESLPSLALGQYDSAVSMATDAGYSLHAVWRRNMSGSGSIWYAQCRAGMWDTTELVGSASLGVGRPSIACASGGDLMVVWQGRTPNRLLARRKAGGVWLASDTVSTAPACDFPCVASLGDSDFLAVWRTADTCVVGRARTRWGWDSLFRVDADRYVKRGPSIAASTGDRIDAYWISRAPTGDSVLLRSRVSGVWRQISTLAYGQATRERVSSAAADGLAQVAWTEWHGNPQRPAVRLRRFEKVHDVAVAGIDGLPEEADSGVVAAPRARVVDRGEFGEQDVAVVLTAGEYRSEVRLDSLAPGETASVSFDPLVFSQRGWLSVVCSTSVAGDRERGNDTLCDSVYVSVYDLRAVTIASPDTLETSGTVQPSAVFRNSGNRQAESWCRFSVWRGGVSLGVDSAWVSLQPGETSLTRAGTWELDTGRYVARCSAAFEHDMHPENDTASRAFRVIRRDAGVVAILVPSGRVDSGAPVVPRARVGNWGSEVESFPVVMRVDTDYCDTAGVSALAPGEWREVGFVSCTLQVRGSHVVSCSTILAGDRNSGNNALRESIFVRVADAAVATIVFPTEVISRGTVEPQVVVANYGNEAELLRCWFRIDASPAAVYLESLQVELGPESDSLVRFAVWNAVGGQYAATSWSGLCDDMHPDNDTSSRHFAVARVDAAMEEIARPAGVVLAGRIEPEVVIGNRGEESGDVRAFLTITSTDSVLVYADSVWALGVHAGERRNARFRQWAAEPGACSVRAWVRLGGEENRGNDTLIAGVLVESLVVRHWTEMASLPRGPRNLMVSTGGGLAASETGLLALKGRGTAEFYSYDASGDSWSARSSLPLSTEGGKLGRGAALAAGGGVCLALRGNKSRDLLGYSASADTWAFLRELPVGAGARFGSSLAIVPGAETTKAHLVLGGNTLEFLVYWVEQDEWHARRPLPAGPKGRKARRGTAIVAHGSRVFCLKGGTNEFYEYLPAGDSWRTRAALPLVNRDGRHRRCRDGAALAADGSRFIYALKGGSSNAFWRYDVPADSWTALEDVPMGYDLTRIRAGSALASVEGRVYCLKGGSRELRCYDPQATGAPSLPQRSGVTSAPAIRPDLRRPLPTVSRTSGFTRGPAAELRDASGRHVTTRQGLLPAGVYFVVSGDRAVRRVVVCR